MVHSGFSNNLKKAKNIAIIANPTKGIDSFCASIGIAELVKEFINQKETSVSVYFCDALPDKVGNLPNRVNVHKRFGEKTLYIKFPSDTVSKVVYDFDKVSKQFSLGLVGVTGSVTSHKDVVYKVAQEQYDMCIGVGFVSEDRLKEYLKNCNNCKNFFNFSKKDLKSKSLTRGVIDLYFKENVVPSTVASLSFFTYLGEKH